MRFNGETPAELIDPLDVLFTVNGSSGRKEGARSRADTGRLVGTGRKKKEESYVERRG